MTDFSDRKILYLTAARFPTNKAYGYQILKMCESMVSIGRDVHLFFPALAPRQALNLGVPQQPDLLRSFPNKKPFRFSAVPGSKVWDLLYSDDSSLWHLVKILLFSLQSRNIIWQNRGEKPIVIWTRDLPVLLVLLLGHPFKDDLIVFECHDLPKRLTVLLAPLLKKLPRIIVTTAGLKKQLAQIGFPKDRVLVLPNAVDLDAFHIRDSQESCRRAFGLPLDRPIIGYIGRFQTYNFEKGLTTLVRSAKYFQWRNNAAPLFLLVGGPGELAKEYLRIAVEIGIPDEMIRILDFQPRQDVPKWIRACDVCVIPSPRKSLFMDVACPLKLFEYMAVGVPVVASDLPAIREVIHDGENGVLVEPDDPSALAQGIQSILQDPNLGKRLAHNGFQTIKENTWEKRTESALAFITGEKAAD